MAYGFRVFNSSGFIQVDENFATYAVYQSGSVSVGAGGVVDVPLSDLGTTPLIFLRVNHSSNGIAMAGYASSTFRLWGPSVNAGATTVDWYTVVPTNYVSASGNYGLRVFNASGVPVFDSRRSYPRIRQVIQTGATSASEQFFGVVGMPSGGKPYYCGNLVGGLVGAIQTGGSQFQLLYNIVRQTSNSSVSVRTVGQGPFAGVISNSTYPEAFQLIMADSA